MIHLLDALRDLGGAASCSEVYDWFLRSGHARAEDVRKVQRDGGTRFRKEVRFARKELFDAGAVANDGPGLWRLTSAGESLHLDHESANRLVAQNRLSR